MPENDASSPAPGPVTQPEDSNITIDEFARMDLRTATVLEVNDHPNADKLYVLKIQVGETTKQIVAGIKGKLQPEQIVGKTIIVVHNLKEVNLRGQISQGMLLAAKLPGGGLTLATTVDAVPSGVKLS